MKLKTITASIAALGLAATAAQAVHAAEPEQSTSITAPAADLSARRAVRDQQTGKLRAPTEAEAKAMDDAERAARKARGLPEVEAVAAPVVRIHPSGARSAQLGPEYLVTLKARRAADGKLVVTHDQPGLDHPVSRNDRPTE